MCNYKKLFNKSKEVNGFSKTFGETCRPTDNDIATLDTKAKEMNKISKVLLDDDIKEIEKNNSKKGNKKRSIFYKDIKCNVDVFDFDEINNPESILSVDAFMVNDNEDTYLMIECKERSMVLINKHEKYLTRQIDTIQIKSMSTVKKAVKSMFDKYKGTLEKLKHLDCNVEEYFRSIILFIDIRVAEELSLVEKDNVRRIIRVEVNKYIERYKQNEFSFQVIYDEYEIVSRVEKMDEKRKKLNNIKYS